MISLLIDQHVHKNVCCCFFVFGKSFQTFYIHEFIPKVKRKFNFVQIVVASTIPDSGIVQSSAVHQMENVTCPDCVTCYLKCKCILPGTDIVKNFSDFIQPRPDHCPECVCDETDDCLDSTIYKQCPAQ